MAHISNIVKVSNNDDYAQYLEELNRYNMGYTIEFVNEQPLRYPCWIMEMFHLTPSDDGYSFVIHLYSDPMVK